MLCFDGQVLPSRTHPEMVCSGTGGFILSGYKVCPDAGQQQPEEPQGGQKRGADGRGTPGDAKRARS